MSKYDKDRERLGIKTNSTSTTVAEKKVSKYANRREELLNPGLAAESQIASFKQSEQKFGSPIVNPANTPVMQQAKNLVDHPKKNFAETIQNSDYSHNIPVVGGALKFLDSIFESKAAKKVSDIASTFYLPGGGGANVTGLFNAADAGIAKALPGLASNVAGRLTQKAAANAITGVPLGVGQYQAMGGEDVKGALHAGLAGAEFGGGLGVLGGAAGEVIGKINKQKLAAAYDKMFATHSQAAQNRNTLNLGEIDKGTQNFANRYNFLDQQTNRSGTQPLQLNEPKSATMARELQNRSVLPANSKPILGQGDVAALGLPSGNYTAPTRLKVNTPAQTLDHVITKIRPEVIKIIEAPARRDLLIQYLQKNGGYNYEDLVNRPMKILQEHAAIEQAKLQGNMEQIAAQVAAKYGHDLPALLEGKAPNIRTQLARDTQSQVYGVQPPRIGIRQPEFNVQHVADAALPETKVGRAPGAIQEAAAPKLGSKPIEQQPRATISDNTSSLKVKVELPRTASPMQRVSGIRGNFQNQIKNGNLSGQLKGKIGNLNQSYERVTNQGSLDRANEAIKNLPKAESDFLLNESGGPDHIANGYRLMQTLDAQGEHARALVISDKLAKDLTKSGQTSQAASILSRLSPEGQLLNLVRQASKNGKEVSVKDSIAFKEQAKKVQQNAGAGIRANQFTEILDRAAKGEKLTPEDVQKMSEYLASAEKAVKPKVIKVVDDLPNELKEPRKRDRIISYLDDAEQAALARIKARKSTLNAGVPIGEWKDHAIVVAAQIVKGSIKAATHTEDLVKLFGEEIRPVASQVFQKAQSLLKSVSPGVSANDMTKANEAFKRVSGQVKEVNPQEKIVEKYVRENPKVSPKDIDTLRNLAKSLTKLSGDSKIEADIAMQKILNSYEKSSAWDKVTAIRYMAMLLNTSTQAINAGSGPMMATLGHTADVFGTMLDITMSKALNTPRTTTLYGTNPLKFIARYLKGLKIGGSAGSQGVNPAGIQGTNEIRGLAFKSLYNPLGLAERALGAVAKGPDYATYSAVYKSELEKQGFLSAINSGIKRSNKQAIKSHIENFVNDPPEEAMLQADRIGKNTTFQRSDSTGGKIANYINAGPAAVKPVVNTVLPFVRTPINIASTAVTMTPAGIIKGLFQLTSKSKASQREAIRTLSLGITGSGLSAVGYQLFNLGIITGANDSGNKDVNAIKEQAGKGKYRFNQSGLARYLSAVLDGKGSDAAEKAAKYQEGDHAFDYNKLQPFAFPLAIGAGLAQNKSKSLGSQIGSAGTDAYGSLFGMSTLKGVQDVFQPQYGGTQGDKSLGVASRIAESFFKSFSPGSLAQEARRQDPIVRKTPYNDGLVPDVKEYFKSRIPGLSQSLPASKTTLGANKMNAPGFAGQYANPYKSEVAAYSKAAVIISDLIDRTGDQALAPTAPEKTVEFKGKDGAKVKVAIPQDRYEQLQEEIGHNIILKIMAIPENLADDKKADRIKDIYKSVRKKEMDKVERELRLAQ